MEILKKAVLLSALFTAILAKPGFAQTDSGLLKAFSASYAEELKLNYAPAIKALGPVYNEKSYELNLRLGWLYYLSKNYTTSAAYYQKAVNLKPGAAEARFGLVKPLAATESWDKVMAQYDAILKADPKNVQARYWKGVIYYNRKQYNEARQQLLQVLELYPFDYDANYMLGWVYLMIGKKADARTLFSEALMIRPGDAAASDGLGRCK